MEGIGYRFIKLDNYDDVLANFREQLAKFNAKKLAEKGFFKMENSMVTSLVSKEEYNSYQREKFVKETFHGSLPALVLSFGSRKKLDQEEIDELQKIIDSMRG